MKRLTLVRHAQAESQNTRGTDFERSLTRRGYAEADALANRLLAQQLVPDLLLTSTAQRAKQTAEILARELSLAAAKIKYDERLYRGRAEDILRVAQAADSDVQHLMIVGHNPGISDLAQQVALPAGITQLDTAAACTTTFDIRAWREARPRR